MTTILLALVALALLVLAGCAVTALRLVTDRRQLGVVAARLATEQRVEQATRATLKAMRAAVHRVR